MNGGSNPTVHGRFCLCSRCVVEHARNEKPKPLFYPCGCSHLKVALGRCDGYDANGAPRRDDAHSRVTVKP